MKPFIESGDRVRVVMAVNEHGEETHVVDGVVASWPSNARPASPRIIKTEFGATTRAVEIGHYLSVWRISE